MKLIVLLLTIITLTISAQVSVKGYYRKNGTYVQPHQRSKPDGNPYNNYSYPGNTNPYTGKTATGNPDTYLENYNNKGNNYLDSNPSEMNNSYNTNNNNLNSSYSGNSLKNWESYSINQIYIKKNVDYGTLSDEGNKMDFILVKSKPKSGKYAVQITNYKNDLFEIKGSNYFIKLNSYHDYVGYEGEEGVLEIDEYGFSTYYKKP